MAAPVGQQAALHLHLAACEAHVLLEGCSMAYRELEDHGLFTICSLITIKLGSLKHLSAEQGDWVTCNFLQDLVQKKSFSES